MVPCLFLIAAVQKQVTAQKRVSQIQRTNLREAKLLPRIKQGVYEVHIYRDKLRTPAAKLLIRIKTRPPCENRAAAGKAP